MKFTGFAASCIGKILLVVLCLVLGGVLTLGGLALGVYVTVTQEGGVGTISDYASDAGIEFKFDDEIREMSVLAWVTEVIGAIGELSTSEIGSLERLLGTDLISSTIEDVLGVDAELIAASTLDGLGETVSNNLSVASVRDKFGIDFPDMPIFRNDNFLSSPLSSAFGSFDEYKLGEILEITDESNTVLRELSGVAVKDIGAASTDETIKSMLLCQLMDIDDDSNKTLQALKYSCIESQYVLDISGGVKVDENGRKVYKTKTIKEDGETKTVELIGINDMIDTLYVKDVVDITDDSAVVLRKMRKATEEEIAEGKANMYGSEDLLLNDLAGGKVTEIINDTKIGELVDIVETGENKSEPILIALKDTTVKTLNNRIKTLALSDLFEEEDLDGGALGLIPSTTTIDGIPSALTNVVTNATTATFVAKNLIAEDDLKDIDKLNKEQQAFIYNNNIGGMVSSMIDFIGDPIDRTKLSLGVDAAINYHYIEPEQVTVTSTEFTSLSDFVECYLQYSSVSFIDGEALPLVTVSVDADKDAAFYDAENDRYLIPLFNVKTATELRFEGGTVQVAVYDVKDGGMELSHNQYGYYYAATGAVHAEKGFDAFIFAQD